MRKGTGATIQAVVIAAGVSAFVAGSSPASAAGDAAAGQEVFARCAPCHSTTLGEKKVGPSLAGVFGRESASAPGYSYSAALKALNVTWNEHTLDQFLASPAADVHGTKMFISVPNATTREDLIAYLKTLK